MDEQMDIFAFLKPEKKEEGKCWCCGERLELYDNIIKKCRNCGAGKDDRYGIEHNKNC